jgi:hypothetical protein
MPATKTRETVKPTGKPKRAVAPNRLAYLRERHRAKGGFWLTMAEVGKILGISEAAVSRHESRDARTARGLSHDDVLAYAKLYKVEPHEIFEGLTIEPTRRSKP